MVAKIPVFDWKREISFYLYIFNSTTIPLITWIKSIDISSKSSRKPQAIEQKSCFLENSFSILDNVLKEMKCTPYRFPRRAFSSLFRFLVLWQPSIMATSIMATRARPPTITPNVCPPEWKNFTYSQTCSVSWLKIDFLIHFTRYSMPWFKITSTWCVVRINQ